MKSKEGNKIVCSEIETEIKGNEIEIERRKIAI